jgi:hypothetical protein
MNLGRWLPLLSLGKRSAGSLNPEEMQCVATALAGAKAANLLPLLELLAEREPDTHVANLLGSDLVAELCVSLTKGRE